MGGGLLQLVAYGAQDVYLTGNPQIQISRNGDLIHRVYLAVVDYSTTPINVCPYFGLRLINYVEIEIGGQKIDKHYSHWMYVWNELSLPVSKKDAYKKMVGANDKLAPLNKANLYIPLEFWFCRNVGLALPLIALQYHEVKINILFETKDNCIGDTTGVLPELTSTTLWVDYIFLDTDERRRFAQLSHEYLIEQLQFTGTESVSSASSIKPKLSFNHPCKELVWFCSSDHTAIATLKNVINKNWINYSTTATKYDDSNTSELYVPTSAITSTNPIKSAKLVLNGNDRFSAREGSYFNLIQPYQHHENIPSNPGINVYSFALKPEEHQPSGTLNMSRIDTAVLNLDINQLGSYTVANAGISKNLHVYAVNYNVLRILSGMGGLAYSN